MTNQNKISIEFFGDLSLNGLLNDPAYHYKLKKNMRWVNQTSKNIDFKVINWESQLWGDGKYNDLRSLRISTTLEAAQSVKPLKIDLALLANNHVYDNHLQGFKNTINFFKQNNINFIGAKEKLDSKKDYFIFSKNGIKIGILNYVGLETNPTLPSNCPIKLNIMKERNVVSKIKKLKNIVDHVVVALHWGKHEYSRIPHINQRKLGKKFIDKGASLVIGSHVHCIQGFEKYNKGLICYSLGNFIFGDGIIHRDKLITNFPKDFYKTLVLNVIFTKKKFKFSCRYFIRKNIFLEPDDGSTKNLHLKTNKFVAHSNFMLSVFYKIELKLRRIRKFINNFYRR